MGPDNIGGAWIIFPIIMIPTMLTFMYLVFVRGGRPPWQDAGGDHRGPGAYGASQSYGEPAEDREPGVSEAPLDILNRRYASGEISKEEFDEMKRDLA